MITIEISNPKIEKKFTKKEIEKIVNDYLEELDFYDKKEIWYDNWLFENISKSLKKHEKNIDKWISSESIKNSVMEKVKQRFWFSN